jgi:hypothetical protein
MGSKKEEGHQVGFLSGWGRDLLSDNVGVLYSDVVKKKLIAVIC